MDRHLYLITHRVEALVASMLAPEEFGTYMATGTKKRSRDKLLFFEVDYDFDSDYFDLGIIDNRCVPHPDGTPKHSAYVSIYRVLEHLDLSQIGDLYCVTRDGRVLRLAARTYEEGSGPGPHLYQELCPVSPLIASDLAPRDSCRFVTDRSRPVSVPKIFFADLVLPELDTAQGEPDAGCVPYKRIEHIRQCLRELGGASEKRAKTVNRAGDQLFYCTVKDGFFLGAGETMKWYPFPSPDEMESQYHLWWRSATLM